MTTTLKPTASVSTLLSILSYRRASGSASMREFERKHILPLFGQPLPCGTYLLTLGEAPTTMFCAHLDSVERAAGRVSLTLGSDDTISIDQTRDTTSVCLGADDGAGIWLILEMIAAGVPAVYALFADEEVGCAGSSDFVYTGGLDAHAPQVTKCISFDRPGTTEIVTHMCGRRGCSDEFAAALSAALDMGHVLSSKGGVTDAAVLSDCGNVREATNVAVGYINHHTRKETLDLDYLLTLRAALVAAADLFETLPVVHDGSVEEAMHTAATCEVSALARIVFDQPDDVADLLYSLGFTAADLRDALRQVEYGRRQYL